jgi:hypothetical protein
MATQFQSQALVTIYDPTYLLKCTHNLFLKYDVHFDSEHFDCQLFVTARWEHHEVTQMLQTQYDSYAVKAD